MQVMKFKREMKLFRLLFRYFNYLILINNLCTDGARQKTSSSSSDSNGAGAEGRDASNPNWEFQQMTDDYKEDLDMNPLQDGDPVANNRITVCIRKRPLSSKEEKAKDIDVVTVASSDYVTIYEPKTKVDLTKFLENQQFRLFFAPNTIIFLFFHASGLIASLTTLQATR